MSFFNFKIPIYPTTFLAFLNKPLLFKIPSIPQNGAWPKSTTLLSVRRGTGYDVTHVFYNTSHNQLEEVEQKEWMYCSNLFYGYKINFT